MTEKERLILIEARFNDLVKSWSEILKRENKKVGAIFLGKQRINAFQVKIDELSLLIPKNK